MANNYIINWRDYYNAWQGVALSYMYGAVNIPMRGEVISHSVSQMLIGALNYISNEVGYICEDQESTTHIINHLGIWYQSEHLNKIPKYSVFIDEWRKHDPEGVTEDENTVIARAKMVYEYTKALIDEYDERKRTEANQSKFQQILETATGNLERRRNE